MAYVADHLSSCDRLPGHNGKTRHMTEERLDSMAVVDDDLTTVAVCHLRRTDDAVSRGDDRGSVGSADVDAGVELSLTIAEDRVLPLAEAAGDGTYYWPDRRPVKARVHIPESGDTAK